VAREENQLAQLEQVELAICIGERHQLVTAGKEPTSQGRAVALVQSVPQQPGAWRTGDRLFHNLGRIIRTAIIHDDDLEFRQQFLKCGVGLTNCLGDHPPFVERRYDQT
jgi:hypothetical protein